MTDNAPIPPRAEKALARLHKLAEGNHVAPGDIALFSAEDKIYDIPGTITLSPLFETAGGRYAGPARGKGRRVMDSVAAMKAEIDRLKMAFESKPTWIPEAIAQLKDQPAGGWGLDDVRINLPQQSVILAASFPCPTCQGSRTTTCPQCHGQGNVICTQCHGNRQELCPTCLGSGKNPAQPDQNCYTCHGMRYTPCRYCQGRGQLVCPTCNGNRGTTCQACGGAGSFTEEVAITCGAHTSFKIDGKDLPSGLRRGLDRLGMANLVKGHADIESIEPVPEEDDGIALPPPVPGEKPTAKKEKPPKPEVHYLAHLPYADLRMAFPGKRAVVGVFGKREVLLGVPPFLDGALHPQREILKRAAKGEASLHDALSARLMVDALKLQIAGQGNVNALRKIYPQGLSPQIAAEILQDMRLALNKTTLQSRSLMAGLGTVLGGAAFAALFLTPLNGQITDGLQPAFGFAVDMLLLLLVMGGCWLALSAATRFALQRRFPAFAIPLTQKTGKTGYAMLAGLAIIFTSMLLLTPLPPAWLIYLRGLL